MSASLFEPWILSRLVAGLAAAATLLHAAWVGGRVVRYFRLGSTGEGQLALERQAELGAASARVGATLQAGALLLSVAAADQLTSHVRGAMCGYGVVHANDAGTPSILASIAAAASAAVLGRLLALDRAVRGLDLLRPLAALSMVVASLALLDLSLIFSWLGNLDFSVVASCCSSGLDAGQAALSLGSSATGRSAATALAALLAPTAALLAFLGARRPTRRGAVAAGLVALAALPPSFAAVTLVVAPHVYEVPHHRCPYCLFRADSLGLGYPLFAALLVAAVWSSGAALAAWLAPRDQDAFAPFARSSLRVAAWAWVAALTLGVGPVVRYLWLSGGVLL